MIGIILAGGIGSRLSPMTLAINKHLLPIYDKPMIYYPLSNLMLAGCKKILIVSTTSGIKQISNLLKDGNHLGIEIEYVLQEDSDGIPSAINKCQEKVKNNEFWVTLGDNFIFGSRIQEFYSTANKSNNCSIFIKKVGNIKSLGEAVIKSDKVHQLIEKPNKDTEGFAVTGLYKFNEKFFNYFQKITKSKRGETEILDILDFYLKDEDLSHYIFGRGVSWIDAGTNRDLIRVSGFVKDLQDMNSALICSPEELAITLGLTSTSKIQKYVNSNIKNTDYGKKLLDLFNNEN